MRQMLNPRVHTTFWKRLTKDLRYLAATRAPKDVLAGYLKGKILERGVTERFNSLGDEYAKQFATLKRSTDWFSDWIPYWLFLFSQYRLESRPNIRALEIGSWEGLSAFFTLSALPDAELTCVDTWRGADEHTAAGSALLETVGKIEQNFDSNMKQFGKRLKKYKGTSFDFFNALSKDEKFDLIYVDGSHYADDVLVDAVKSFNHLNVGGMMIFDDYLWKYYARAFDNPAAAVNCFLRLKEGAYKVAMVHYQLAIVKTMDLEHERQQHLMC